MKVYMHDQRSHHGHHHTLTDRVIGGAKGGDTCHFQTLKRTRHKPENKKDNRESYKHPKRDQEREQRTLVIGLEWKQEKKSNKPKENEG